MSRPWAARLLACVSRLLMRAAVRLLGGRHVAWARAMQAEIEAVPTERETLAFAWGCFGTAWGEACATAFAGFAQPHQAGAWACATAVLLGGAFMHAAGAPGHYLPMNLVSLAFALATFCLLPRQRLARDAGLRAQLAFALGALLLAGSWVAGSPWVRLGPVQVNLPWLLLPALLVAADASRVPAVRRWAVGGLLMAVAALALLADPVLAACTAAVLSVRAWHGRSGALAGLAAAAWATALHASASWQAPAPLPFVDGVLQRGFAQAFSVGLALALLQLLPLWPALQHRRARPLGWVWGLMVLLSLPGWLPSPLIGFGGSFVLGYVLSLALLPGDLVDGAAGDPPPAAGHRQIRLT